MARGTTRHGLSLADQLELMLHEARVPAFEREFRFHGKRRWRFDFAWPAVKVAAEVEGGVWIGGRHTRPLGFLADCEKYNEATAAGWRVFRYPRDMVLGGQAVAQIANVLAERRNGHVPGVLG